MYDGTESVNSVAHVNITGGAANIQINVHFHFSFGDDVKKAMKIQEDGGKSCLFTGVAPSRIKQNSRSGQQRRGLDIRGASGMLITEMLISCAKEETDVPFYPERARL